MRFEFELERAGEQGPGEMPLDGWALRLPRRFDSWEIGEGTLEEVLEAAREFRAGLDEAIRELELELEQARAEDVPAAYAAARTGAARSLRAVEASLVEAAGGAPLRGPDALPGVLARMLERPSPFASVPIRAFDLVVPPGPPPWDGPRSSARCHVASFGWVHVRPGCRCPR